MKNEKIVWFGWLREKGYTFIVDEKRKYGGWVKDGKDIEDKEIREQHDLWWNSGRLMFG